MRKLAFLFAAMSCCLIQSCDSNDNETIPSYVSPETRAAFDEKFPSAKDVAWENRSDFLIAGFKQNKVEKEAWFDHKGGWYMTETDIPFNQLPDAVKTAFQQSEYASWTVDDVDMIERQGAETIYVIEVEQGDSEVDLYYAPDGILVRTVLESDDDDYEHFIPSQLPSSVEAYLNGHHPSARIIDIDWEHGMLEVEIVDGTVCRELLFDGDGNWMQTETEIRVSSLPDAVMEALRTSPYAAYEIDDADFIQTPAGEWYLIELESGHQEVELRIDAAGNIL